MAHFPMAPPMQTCKIVPFGVGLDTSYPLLDNPCFPYVMIEF